MMGYISINPKLCLCAWLLNTLMLVCDIDLNYVCVLGCSEEPNLSPGVLNEATLSHPCAHTTNRAQHHRQQFQHHRQGGQGLPRTITKSIYIRVNNHQNNGKYNLSHIWYRVLFNTPGLKLGSSQQPSTQT